LDYMSSAQQSSFMNTVDGLDSMTNSLEFTGSLTSAGNRTRPKSANPKLQRSRFPTDFSMSIDTFPSVLEIPTSTTIAETRFRKTQTMGGGLRGRRSRKSIPETPLSPETVRENYKTAKALKALNSHDRKKFMRVTTNKDTIGEVVKKQVSEKLSLMTSKLKTAVRLHNAIKSPHNKEDERVEEEEVKVRGSKDKRGEGGKPKPASYGSRRGGAKKSRPKSAPMKRDPGGSRNFTLRTNRAAAEVDRKLIVRRQQEEQRKAEVKNGGNSQKRPMSAAPVLQRQGTSEASLNKVGTMRPKARPRSAAMARKAKDKTISNRDKALIVQQLLGSVAGNTLASPLMTKDMKKEIFKMSSEKRVMKAKKFKKKRVLMEKKRINDIYEKDWNMRMERLKAMNKSQQDRENRGRQLLVAMHLANRARFWRFNLYRAYTEKDLNEKKQKSAEVITRQLRLYSYRSYRSKVRGAIKVLGAFFILRIRLWKKRRDARCADLVVDFLRKLKRETCLKLIVKGGRMKRWNNDIIVVQRGWRRKARNISAQMNFIDMQLMKHQEAKLDELIDQKYDEAVEVLVPANEEIERKNKGRRLMNKRLLPRALPKSKHAMKAEILKEEDLLGKHFVPMEIRRGIIRYYLMQAKRLHHEKVVDWKARHARWEELMKVHRRRGMMMKSFQPKPKKEDEKKDDVVEITEEEVKRRGGERIPRRTADLTHARSKTMSFMKHHEHEDFEENGLPPTLIEPIKPLFKAMMSEMGILFLMDACRRYMAEMRNHWNPNHASHYRCSKTNQIILRKLPDFKELGFWVAERLEQSEKDEKLIAAMGW